MCYNISQSYKKPKILRIKRQNYQFKFVLKLLIIINNGILYTNPNLIDIKVYKNKIYRRDFMGETENKNQIITKFGSKVAIIYASVFLLPIFMGYFLCSYLKVINIKDSLKISATPFAICMFLLIYVYIILLYVLMTKKNLCLRWL